ncbi:glutathione S-transferase family protein [Noviherbaspirillum sp.]|jgi:glutathione S-transferase|uniref:glutathione S-transferase family protein n=1 Tax=Noviherbaspirillum sp. TaxID=1926288 RepID=UPI0025FD9AA5|nr:glutathione S-transferase family protein [Noviherbaspirillum sp.]
MYKIYGDVNSGNCYKVKLLAEQLSLPYEWIDVDTLKKETQSSAYLEKNPNGKIPLLETEDGRFLPESNAILHFLAEGSAFLPTDRFEHAQVLQWLFFEQYSHEPYIATARYIIRYLGRPAEMEPALQSKMAPGYKALCVMESHLRDHPYFVGGRYSIADIGLFAYTHVAHEGDFALSEFPAIVEWIKRVRAQPGFVEIG